jgi:hypothetical protein
MELFQLVKGLKKEEAIRMVAVELAIQLHNFRSDVSRNTDAVIDDSKRIYTYITNGT